MRITTQIEKGLFIGPRTGKSLSLNRQTNRFQTEDGAETYQCLIRKEQIVPILLIDEKWAETYSMSSERMTREYAPENRQSSVIGKIKAYVGKDFRSRVVTSSLNEIFDPLTNDDSLVLSIGGGPKREHPSFTNLNVGPFPNVDIVADAHVLPYRDGCVDAIFCEAVIEHLSEPQRAVQEFYRVLKKGGKVLSVVPFMQAYHGYPNHYQNFTLTGHQLLYEKNRFRLTRSGTCVGPIYTAIHLSSQFAQEYLPRMVSIPLRIVIHAAGVLLKPLDYRLHGTLNSYIFASTTYVIAQK
jgi:SAM-dependent methyltransferase